MSKGTICYGLLLCISLSFAAPSITLDNEAINGLFDLTLEELLNVKIKVASLHEDTISQSPVPCFNDVHIASRGIYTSSQQKNLI